MQNILAGLTTEIDKRAFLPPQPQAINP